MQISLRLCIVESCCDGKWESFKRCVSSFEAEDEKIASFFSLKLKNNIATFDSTVCQSFCQTQSHDNLSYWCYFLHHKERVVRSHRLSEHRWHFNFTFDISNKQLLCLYGLSLIEHSISSKSIISLDAQWNLFAFLNRFFSFYWKIIFHGLSILLFLLNSRLFTWNESFWFHLRSRVISSFCQWNVHSTLKLASLSFSLRRKKFCENLLLAQKIFFAE